MVSFWETTRNTTIPMSLRSHCCRKETSQKHVAEFTQKLRLNQFTLHIVTLMRIRSCLRDTPVPDPSPYSGEPDKCRSFIFQCTNVFKARPSSFSTDLSKLLFFSGLLRDEALTWVFSKDRAVSLPPHRPYDCAIDFLPGSSLPSSRLYSLSRPERESMESYIK
uniref:DUF4939 domain-containing protein n=1 Tax=Mastacembelus armatus TaxID=205130 RepID=A0A3Q3LU24_9TELE